MYNTPVINPPGPYTVGGLAQLLRANEQQYLFNLQQVKSGTASIAVQLERIKSASYPFGASLEVAFTDANGNPSTPGNFQLDWQDADTDLDARFVTMQSLVNTASLNSSFVGRIELPTMWAKLMRVRLVSITNSVFITALVSR